jgi:uncharacterized protein (DUF1800 family)
MKRRSFLSTSADAFLPADGRRPLISKFANTTLPAVERTQAGLDPMLTPLTRDQIAHLLRRTMFGARKSDVDSFQSRTLDDIVSTLLTDAPPPAPPLNVSTSDTTVPFGQSWVAAARLNADGSNPNSARTSEFKSWWTGLMLNQGTSLTEKMTLFWHNHFVSEMAVVGDARFSYMQNALFRQYALGNVKTLAKLVTIDPAMLDYLNGSTSTKTSPNENYARELQELFTIGKGPEIAPGNYTNYTEDDVKAAAKVLTGWRFDSTALTAYFTLSRHDTTNKQFSADYGGTVITGSVDPTGNAEIDALLSMIVLQDETAKFICRKLYRWFVYYVVDPTTEANVIAPMADIFRANNYEIKPVLRALFKSQHFFDPVNIGCAIKSPIDHAVGLCRETGVLFPASSDLTAQYNHWKYVRTQAANTQMDLGDPPNVAGWAAYYQSPQFYEMWINSDTLPKRVQFSDKLTTTGFKQNNFTLIVDPLAFVAQVSNASSADVIVTEFAQFLFPIAITANQHQFLLDILLSGLPAYEWTVEWMDYFTHPLDTAKRDAVKTKLQALITFMMELAEFQLL